jgi:hypothetical protein
MERAMSATMIGAASAAIVAGIAANPFLNALVGDIAHLLKPIVQFLNNIVGEIIGMIVKIIPLEEMGKIAFAFLWGLFGTIGRNLQNLIATMTFVVSAGNVNMFVPPFEIPQNRTTVENTAYFAGVAATEAYEIRQVYKSIKQIRQVGVQDTFNTLMMNDMFVDFDKQFQCNVVQKDDGSCKYVSNTFHTCFSSSNAGPTILLPRENLHYCKAAPDYDLDF